MNHNIPTIINKFHHHYNQNTVGRDFVVGDIQGCYDQLMHMLKLLKFDSTVDRLFPCGDLIDRGPKSMECANLVYEQHIHSVVGNHEQLMIGSLLYGRPDYIDCWINNGGLWFKDEDLQLLRDIAEKFEQLPHVISVGKGKKRFNIVHAELIRSGVDDKNQLLLTDDETIDKWKFESYHIHDMTWGRTIISQYTDPQTWQLHNNPTNLIKYQSHHLSTTFVGHSIVPYPIQIEQQIYLDTGHVGAINQKEHIASRKPLTIASPNEKMFYQYRLPWRTINKLPFDQIRKFK